MRDAQPCFELSKGLCGHVKLSSHGDGVADPARGTEALESPAGPPQDTLHTHVDDAGDGVYAFDRLTFRTPISNS